MANEPIQPDPNATPDVVSTPKPKSNLLKYGIFGVAGLVAVSGIAFGTLFFIGGSPKQEPAGQASEEPKDKKPQLAHPADLHAAGENTGTLNDDSLMAELAKEFGDDSSVLENIMAELSFLDPQDTANLAGDSTPRLTAADSMQEASWIDEQRKLLEAKEKDLAERERQLQILDTKLQKQMLVIEQAESARITNLAKLYDGMDVRQVATLMANLDDETIVALIPRMKAKNASQVLGLLPPVRAAKLSKQMITIAEGQ